MAKYQVQFQDADGSNWWLVSSSNPNNPEHAWDHHAEAAIAIAARLSNKECFYAFRIKEVALYPSASDLDSVVEEQTIKEATNG
jgi:hypothetical protein